MSSNLKVNTILPSTGTSIGIGTAGGAVLLGATTTSNAEQLRIHTPDSGKAIIKLTNSTTGTGAGDGFEFGLNANEQIEFVNKENTDMFFATNNTERLRIDSSGRLLLGTTTEGISTADDLTIETSGSTGITLRSDAGYAGNIAFSDGTSGADEYRGLIQYHHNGDSMRFFINATEKLRILSDGKLLIGSTNPANNSRLGNELCIVGTEAYTGMSITNYPGTNANHSPLIDFNRSRGISDQSMTSVVAGDKLGELIFRGANGSGFQDAVTLRAYADSISGSNVHGRFEIGTTGVPSQVKFRVNENGHITTPNNVLFAANGGQNDLTNGVFIFTNIKFQRGGNNYNNSNGYFTAPTDGIYMFMCNPYRYTDSNDSYISLQKSTNGGSSWPTYHEVRVYTGYGGDSGRGWVSLTMSTLIDMNKNDIVRIYATNRCHANTTVTVFSGMLVG